MNATSRLAPAALALLVGCAPAPQVAPVPAPAAAFPSTPPQPGPAAPLRLPAPEQRTLPNGLEVIYVRHGSLPIVHARLVTGGGTVEDPASTPGLASFVAEMLDEGAAGLSALELAGKLDLLGASLGTGAGWDAAYVDLHVLRDRLPEALDLMADVVVRPDFPEAEVRRIREEWLTQLARAGDEPSVVADNAFAALVYGASHPYGRLTGTESLRSIERAELVRFHQARYRPAGSTLILVGDVDPAALDAQVQRAFGAWAGAAAPETALPPVPEAGPTTLFLVDKPGAAQSEIRIGHPGAARDTPDYFALQVLNTILGGAFTSRLNTNLREEHGYSYGAFSTFAMRRGVGPFVASSAVVTAKTDSAVVEFFHELGRIREESVPPAELERAKSYVALGLPRRFEATAGVASALADLEVHDLSLDFYNRFVPGIMAVTAEDVQRVASRYLHPDRAVVVVVGDLSQVEAGLRRLELGPVEVRRLEEFVK